MKIIGKLFRIYDEDIRVVVSVLGFKFKFKSEYLEYKRVMEANLKKLSKLLNYVSAPSELPKATGEIREKQLKELSLLKEIKKVCTENGISYWLDCGTFLGAVRHKGFIPWDADADVSVLREDYEKLIPLLKEHFKTTEIKVRESYTCRNKNINYQLCLCNEGAKEYGVDIFPVDKYYLNNLTDDEKQVATDNIVKCWHIVQKTCRANKDYTLDVDKARLYFKRATSEYILGNRQPAAEKPALFWGIDLLMPCSRYRIFEYDNIFPLKEICFEGEIFSCPNNPDNNYLKGYFGNNFMKYPSKFKLEADQVEEYIDNLTI